MEDEKTEEEWERMRKKGEEIEEMNDCRGEENRRRRELRI
jgi:hypothetical protein